MGNMHLSRILLLVPGFLTCWLLTACASPAPTPSPTPTPQPSEAVLTLPELLRAPNEWSGQTINLIGAINADTNPQVLIAQPNGDDPPEPQQALWLAQPPSEDVLQKLRNDPGIVRLRGVLSPPGAYGQEQQFTYQFVSNKIEVLEPQPTTLVNLVDNPNALNRFLLQVEGTLLVQQEAALLASEVSDNGVPTARARLLKLPTLPAETRWQSQLTQSGDVRWGRVQVIGWWQDGQLTPLVITPIEAPPDETNRTPTAAAP